MSQWRIASTRASTVKARTTGANRRIVGPPVHHAAGELHAYRPGDSETACHRDLSRYKLWPTEDFKRGLARLHHCPDCREAANN